MRWLAFLLVLGCPLAASSQQYVGAKQAIGIFDPAATASNGANVDEQIKAFASNAKALTPEAAAKEWFRLALKVVTKPTQEEMSSPSGFSFNPERSAKLMAALPPPASWPIIEQLAKARIAGGAKALGDYLILLTAQVLQANVPGEWQTLDTLIAKAPKGGGGYGDSIFSIYADLATTNRDAARLDKALRLSAHTPRYDGTVEVPDVVSVMGAAKAEVLLRDLILNYQVSFPYNGSGEATGALARKIALDNLAKLKAPQWGLAASIDAAALYEGLQQRFPVKPEKPGAAVDGPQRMSRSNPDTLRQTARIYYVLGLIVHGKADQAAATVIHSNGDPLNSPSMAMATYELYRKGYSVELYTFLSQVLEKHPELPLWKVYIEASTMTGHSENLLANLRKGLAEPKQSAVQKVVIEARLADALLAAGQVDEGVAMLKRAMAAKATDLSEANLSKPDLGIKLAKIGHLLKRDDWLEAGLAATEDVGKPVQLGQGSSTIAGSVVGVAEFLFSIGRGPQAEHLLIENLKIKDPNRMSYFGSSSPLVELASIYERAGRPADVVELMDSAKDWSSGDLVTEYKQLDQAGRPFGYIAASALAATGNQAAAARIDLAVLQDFTSYDPAYKLYLDLKGPAAVPFFASLYKLDQFEERPLIWIAESLRRDGKLEEAEKYARQAIAVDPSDGDQHLGTRLLAYSVLADIREARGAAGEAAELRSAVKAIRLAEQADAFLNAGLQTTATKMYEDSLGLFQDAYCIQSRLAVTLAESGHFDEAADHYRRAYELMPNSFGRVETHCLGCEKAFDGPAAQSIAEKVFDDLLVKTPQKPQVHYLIGYLREEEGKYDEAAKRYREAVDLDPEYLNAWVRLASMGEHDVLSKADMDRASIAMGRLDPQRRHTERSEVDVQDLKALWVSVDTALGNLPPVPTSLYPFPAAAAAILANKNSRGMDSFPDFENSYGRYGATIRTASQAVASTKALASVQRQYVNALEQGDEGDLVK